MLKTKPHTFNLILCITNYNHILRKGKFTKKTMYFEKKSLISQ